VTPLTETGILRDGVRDSQYTRDLAAEIAPMYEVELKFPLADPAAFRRRLVKSGARPGPTVDQSDLYFNHPLRDFAQTDEAFRVRMSDGRGFVTYKGPLVDSQTKTRREIEVPLAGNDAGDKFSEILKLLGFRPVREVKKRRELYHLSWLGRDFEVAIDDVADLGVFAEFETLADEGERAAATDAILALISQFQLSPPERRSYLSLLLAKNR
jgi:adenylate cyclase class 2